ncbi:MAG TPA: glycogen/starch synthase [Acidobacteriota bacterium]|nr:glycogen/starch synthase [Acidobacteriota bacterium]
MIDCLFEVSFEVCNKVGGINTVITTKATKAKHLAKEFFLIGPLLPNKEPEDFSEEIAPHHVIPILASLSSQGIKVKFGRWLIRSEPHVILVDFSSLWGAKNDWKRMLWEQFGIDSYGTGYEFEEPVLFSIASGKVIEAFSKDNAYLNKKIVVQTHEWLAGIANLYLKMQKVKVATVFTTHATMLGRSLSGRGVDLFSALKTMNPYQAAKDCGVFEKFTTERACAHHSTQFTTVSDVTAAEAFVVLGRQAIVTPNGLDSEEYPSFEQVAIKHAASKERLIDFSRYFFFPYHQFDLSKTLFYFMSGRNEFHNKGFDVSIAALGELNKKLIESGSDRSVVTFVFIATNNNGVRKDVLMNKLGYRHIKNVIDRIQPQVRAELLDAALSHNKMCISTDLSVELDRLAKRFRNGMAIAPISTHDLNENDHPVIGAAKAAGLLNRPTDRVKLVYYPAYLSGSDELLDMLYLDVVVGCHMGMFLSSYEPWGYTPLESAGLGVPALTTTCAGFGQFVQKISAKREGVFVVDRIHKSDRDITVEVADILMRYSVMNHHDRVRHKIAAKLIADTADWALLIKEYEKAYTLAIEAVYGKA